ncbi:PD-(D/E)XK nuclease family protein [Kribbella solani]|uniref:PD-(D/E)XK endonuclease-like domain-containing protein n=1 Tax=Kribbella solani TaxID=236067 RepID=A0A841DMS8_9ACTN|nr:PD-(D/E)XK nuclease family protein [Kribbella solani]MBB5979842.1 hypothetical protein [Kribbella solani]
MATDWPIPAGATGSARLIRVFAGAAEESAEDCPLLCAVKARPALRLPRRVSSARDLEGFALGPVMAELDRIEFGEAREKSSRPVHVGHRRFVEEAVANYLSAASSSPVTPALVPDPKLWVRQVRSDDLYELRAWGRGYASLDASVRELRLLTFGAAGRRVRDLAQVAMAAYVVAFGGRADRPRYGQAHDVQAFPQPRRVRVVEFGCLGGEPEVLFDGTPEDARVQYEQYAAPALRRSVEATERRPGASCKDCSLTGECGALTKSPGILGVDEPNRARRTVSVTDLRLHSLCPAKAHFRQLRLPSDKSIENSGAVVRGRAVHAWIEQLHERTPRVQCTTGDVPPDPSDWIGGRWSVSGREAERGAAMIAMHAAVCPLRYSDPDSVRSERQLTVYDPRANAVVIATPDLLYQDRGGWVWREVKTTTYRSPRVGADLMETYPQVALAVLILAEGLLGDEPRRSRVELEILRPGGSDLELIQPTRPDVIGRARAIVRQYAGPWHADTTAQARPGDHCDRCEYSRWCPERQLPRAEQEQ